MPEKETLDRAREDAREGKSSSTQAGEFVREENAPYPRRQARRPFHQAGNCDRSVKGQARGCKAAAATQGHSFGTNKVKGRRRSAQGADPPQTIAETFPGDDQGAPA
jgi:hypothetical protein